MLETAGKNRRGQRVIRTVLLESWMDTIEGSKGLSGLIPPSQEHWPAEPWEGGAQLRWEEGTH